MPGFESQREEAIETPFGWPSDNYVIGTLAGRQVAFSGASRARPSHLSLGAEFPGQHLRDEIAGCRAHRLAQRGWARSSRSTGRWISSSLSVLRPHARPRFHVLRRGAGGPYRFADPVCPELSEVVAAAGAPRASTSRRAAPTFAWRARPFPPRPNPTCTGAGAWTCRHDNLQEAKLAREAEICYVTVAMVTDYDCWHPDHDAVTVNEIVATSRRTPKTPAVWWPKRSPRYPRPAAASAVRRFPTPSSRTFNWFRQPRARSWGC